MRAGQGAFVAAAGLPARAARVRRCRVRATSVEDVPAERVPERAADVPAHWARPGVYGVYSEQKRLMYVAAVEDVGAAMRTHIRVLGDPERVFAVRMLTVDSVDDAPLGDMAENWVVTHTNLGPGAPPGNSDEEPEWRVEEDEGLKGDVYFAKGVRGAEEVVGEIRKILRENRVVLFMKGTREEPKCGFSKATVECLEGVLGKNFVCVDCLDDIRNAGLREQIKLYSQWPTIPQVYIDGDFVGGADIVRGMRESGELSKLLEPVMSP